MAHFDIFYFDNYIDPAHPLNPRKILTAAADPILTMVANGCCGSEASGGDEKFIQSLVDVGVLRREKDELRFDTPIFLKEDAPALCGLFCKEAQDFAALLATRRADLYALMEPIDNGFDVQTNLYHILCGMVMDGLFFDALSATGAVATSRIHPSGMDYLTIIYEKCPELEQLSCGLLCSWNRLTNGECALQSFGDSDGQRRDFFRAYRMAEQTGNALPLSSRELLAETSKLIQTGACSLTVMRMLEEYGYAFNGKICVPVYRKECEAIVRQAGELVAQILLEPVAQALRHCSLDITAARHGVDRGELANELYHILFGRINEALIQTGLAAVPPYAPGQGRYLKSIQLF